MDRLRSAILKSDRESHQGKKGDDEEEGQSAKPKGFSVGLDAGVSNKTKAFDPKMIEEKLMSEAILREIKLAILNDEVNVDRVNGDMHAMK